MRKIFNFDLNHDDFLIGAVYVIGFFLLTILFLMLWISCFVVAWNFINAIL